MKDDKWQLYYNFCLEYYNKYKTILMPNCFLVNYNGAFYDLGYWLIKQRDDYKNNKLDINKIKMLDEIEDIWKIDKIYILFSKWYENYLLVKEYYEENKNVLIPSNYEVKNKNNEIVKIGNWFSLQKSYYKHNKLANIKVILLDEINIKDTIKYEVRGKEKWYRNYNYAKEYYNIYGNLLFDKPYEFDGNIIDLKKWIINERYYKKNGLLSDEKIKLLDEIGMNWNTNIYNKVWQLCYLKLKEYKNIYGDLFISKDYIIKDKHNLYINLYQWLLVQKGIVQKSKKCKTKYNLLNDLGVIWELNESNEIIYIKEYLDSQYNKYINNYLSEDDILKLVNAGVLRYVDDGIEKSDINYYVMKINERVNKG